MKHVEFFINNLKINNMEYQIINGKKFPQFPFYAKGIITEGIYKITKKLSSDALLAELGRNKVAVHAKYITPVSVTEITFDEQPTEKKYRPWTREDVGSLLFFKDKIFRLKESTQQTTVIAFDSNEDASTTVALQFDERKWFDFDDLLESYEYSTDGINWLPCGVEI